MSLATAWMISVVLAAPASAATPAEGPAEAERAGIGIGPEGPVPAHVLWSDYVRVDKPRSRGTALMIAAGGALVVGGFIQLGDLAICGNCATGVAERVVIGPAMILAPLGAFMRGRYDAYMDASIGRARRKTTVPIAVGLTMAAIGAIGGLANEVLWWRCAVADTGPYSVPAPIDTIPRGPECRFGAARLGLDGAAILVSSGLGLGLWGLKYRHDTRAYDRAVFAVIPRIRAGEFGLGVGGRF